MRSKSILFHLSSSLLALAFAACDADDKQAADRSSPARSQNDARDAGSSASQADASSDERSETADAGAAPSEPDAGGKSTQPLYVAATRVFSDEGSNGYLFTVPSLDASQKVELSQAIEITDAWVFGDADPYFYTATIFEPQITRWTVSEAGELEKGPTVDFSNEAVTGTYTAASQPLFSKNKSYFIDPNSMQVVVWDPAEMAFIRTIALDADPIGEFTPNMDLRVRGEQLVVSIFWTSEASGWTEYGEFVRVVVIDTQSDTVVSTHDDDRCSSISSAGVAKDGTMYFGPWDYHTVVRSVFGEAYGAKSCGFRLRKDQNELDADYALDLSGLTGGKPTGSMQIFEGSNTALLHVWQPDLLDVTKENWSDKRFEPGYLWYRWEIGSDKAEPLPDQEPSGEGGDWSVLDGRNVNLAPNEEYTKTTLFELQADGSRRELLTVPGWTAHIIRAR